MEEKTEKYQFLAFFLFLIIFFGTIFYLYEVGKCFNRMKFQGIDVWVNDMKNIEFTNCWLLRN